MITKTDIIELTKKYPDFHGIYWVIKCMKKDKSDKRDYIRCVRFSNKTITASDGNRVHSYTTKIAYPDGFYSVVKCNRSDIFLKNEGTDKRYPKVDDILVPPKEIEPFTVSEITRGHADIIRNLDIGTINYNYLCDLLVTHEAFDCFTKDDSSPIVFRNTNKRAAVMAMRIKL